jgi:hypothetical protein
MKFREIGRELYSCEAGQKPVASEHWNEPLDSIKGQNILRN